MISPGILYDLREDIQRTDLGATRGIAIDLLDEVHRLRHLLEEMADFRASREHAATMASLKEIKDSLR